MTTVIVQHNVNDFDAWKPRFDGHSAVRDQHGCSSADVYRSVDDPNAVTVVLTFPSLDAARGFEADPSLKDAMATGGVTGPPSISFLEPAEKLVG